MNRIFAGLAATAAMLFTAALGNAAIVITEAMSSSGAGGTADWFEVTNTGSSPVSLTGWKMDDGPAAFAASVPLRGISSIAAGESVVFLELAAGLGADDATVDAAGAVDTAAFRTFWGANAAAIQIGYYNGSNAGVGLSSGGDGVNLFDTSSLLVSGVTVPAATTGFSFEYLTTPGTATLSADGVLGGYISTNPLANVGSPGFTANAVPEPTTWALILCGMGGLGLLARRRTQR